jgi:hypothetical protein
MKTKNLVLGFCSLVAVTGAGAPQVFGDTDIDMELMSLDDVCVPQEAPVTKRAHLARVSGMPIMSADPQRQEICEEMLDFTKQRLKAETAALSSLGWGMVGCVQMSLLTERNANFAIETARAAYESAKQKLESMEWKVIRADEFVEQVNHSVFSCLVKNVAVARANRLRLKLAKAEEHFKLMSKQLDTNGIATNLLVSSRKFREVAIKLHADRRELLTALCTMELEKHAEGQVVIDRERVRSGQFIPETEWLVMSGFRDLAVFNEFDYRVKLEVEFAKSISEAIQCHENDRWFGRETCGFDDSYRVFLEKEPRVLCCDEGQFDPIKRQVSRLRSVAKLPQPDL